MKYTNLENDLWRQFFCQKVYHDQVISSGAKKACEQIADWTWEWTKWDAMLYELYEFVEENEVYPPADSALGYWIQVQNQTFFKGQLSIKQSSLLGKLKYWVWDEGYNDLDLDNYQIAILRKWWDSFEIFKQEINAIGFPPNKSTHEKYAWWSCQRRSKKLSVEQIEALASVHELWQLNTAQYRFRNIYSNVRRFLESKGRLPYGQEKQDGYNLGSWLRLQRNRKRIGTIGEIEIALLEELPGWTWNTYDKQWDSVFEKLKAGGLINKGWLTSQRRYYRQGKLTKDKIKRLESLVDWQWNPNEEHKEERIDNLKDFIEVHQRLPKKHEWHKNYKVGQWCTKKRIDYKKGKLSLKQIKQFESIPIWSWTQLEDQWLIDFEKLKKFIKKNKRLPYRSEGALGKWVNRQPQRRNNNQIPAEQIELLDSLPEWTWNKRDHNWNVRYNELLDYLNKFGSLPESSKHRINIWLIAQKKSQDKNKLSKCKLESLKILPFW